MLVMCGGLIKRLPAPQLQFRSARLGWGTGQQQRQLSHPAWVVTDCASISELQLDCWQLEHKKTGAQVCSSAGLKWPI